jgi:hypothetical protein
MSDGRNEPKHFEKLRFLLCREWNSGTFWAIERLPVKLFAVRVVAAPGRKGCLLFLYDYLSFKQHFSC